ncbi:MAG TPA: flagellar hook-basal body complex protein FliE [Steroidobacteraceae bacterium]|nr:flagellar hook-basal body complex protein FliE [Steroidobacteraceae bacterium]
MSQMEIDRVLATIRSFSAQNAGGIGGVGQGNAAAGAAGSTNGVSEFSKLLQKGIDAVNQAQSTANDLATKFEKGVPGVELPQVMLEMQKASVSFRALTEVRNRLVSAYQEIMNMPL